MENATIWPTVGVLRDINTKNMKPNQHDRTNERDESKKKLRYPSIEFDSRKAFWQLYLDISHSQLELGIRRDSEETANGDAMLCVGALSKGARCCWIRESGVMRETEPPEVSGDRPTSCTANSRSRYTDPFKTAMYYARSYP